MESLSFNISDLSTQRHLGHLFEKLQTMAKIGVWEVNLNPLEVFWSEEVYRIHQVPLGTPILLEEGLNFYHPKSRPIIEKAVELAIHEKESYDLELQLITAKNVVKWVRAIGIPVIENGKVIALQGLFQDIDKQRTTEEALRHIQDKFELAIEAGEVGIWEWNLGESNLQWNQHMHQIFDWPEDVFQNSLSDFTDRLHTDDQDRVADALQVALENKTKYDISYRAVDQQGNIKNIMAKGTAIYDTEDNPVNMIGTCIDITKQLALEQEKHNVKTQLEIFIKHTPVAIAMFDQDLCYLQASHRWYKDYQLVNTTIIGKKHYDIFPEILQMPEWLAIHQRCLNGEVIKMEEDPFLRNNGQTQWLRYEIHPWYTENGQVGGIIMFTEDITFRKQIEIQLQQSEAKFKAAFNEAAIGMALVDLQGRFIKVNHSLCRMLGYSRKELLSLDFATITHVNDLSEGLTQFQEVKNGIRSKCEFDKRYYHKDGSIIWTHLVSSLVNDGSTSFFIAQIQDITQRKHKEQELIELNKFLDEKVVQRTQELLSVNEELESFNYSVSHDLRTPLRSILGFAQALEEDYDETLDDIGKDFLHRITKASKRMSELIDSLLYLSRIGRRGVIREEVNLSELVKNIALDLQEAFPQQSYCYKIAPNVKTKADLGLLKIVLENLLDNAMKYSSKTHHPVIEFGEIANKVYYVADQGVGFDMSHANKLFGAFQRLHSTQEFEGMGVGLATVKRIIMKHRGKIWAESSPNNGATFYFTLDTQA
ncbi:PAS domain S-box protein [uncultured Microscilla sp.]|uniref:PAS domain-containing sensor histidine kinase n=1 Tax=uncultured Microscilla sp. TaxID=432653 RepID=UPI0026123467|nr:PAS domain S-box protein [uncultured Microscilla sp.]